MGIRNFRNGAILGGKAFPLPDNPYLYNRGVEGVFWTPYDNGSASEFLTTKGSGNLYSKAKVTVSGDRPEAGFDTDVYNFTPYTNLRIRMANTGISTGTYRDRQQARINVLDEFGVGAASVTVKDDFAEANINIDISLLTGGHSVRIGSRADVNLVGYEVRSYWYEIELT